MCAASEKLDIEYPFSTMRPFNLLVFVTAFLLSVFVPSGGTNSLYHTVAALSTLFSKKIKMFPKRIDFPPFLW